MVRCVSWGRIRGASGGASLSSSSTWIDSGRSCLTRLNDAVFFWLFCRATRSFSDISVNSAGPSHPSPYLQKYTGRWCSKLCLVDSREALRSINLALCLALFSRLAGTVAGWDIKWSISSEVRGRTTYISSKTEPALAPRIRFFHT